MKTGTGRQAIYAAIGQLLIHSKGIEQTRKVMVLPAEEDLPCEVLEVLSAIGIELWRVELQDDGAYDFRHG